MLLVALTGLMIGSMGGSIIGNGVKLNEKNKIRVDFKEGFKKADKYGIITDLAIASVMCALGGIAEVAEEAFNDTKKDLEEKKDKVIDVIIKNSTDEKADEYLGFHSRMYRSDNVNFEVNKIADETGISRFELFGINAVGEGDVYDIVAEEKEKERDVLDLKLSYTLNSASNFGDLEMIDEYYDYKLNK